tara:strand:+ start:1606 stop:2127 length:522 start_codon:yes stop_codon:yes gene_type:complete
MIKTYDEALPKEWCDSLIQLFENAEQYHLKVDRNYKPKFTSLNVNQVAPQYVNGLVQLTRIVYDNYKKDLDLKHLPEYKKLEEFRIKRYIAGGDERYDEHIDVSKYEFAHRCLSILFYLNTNNGGTEFPRENIIITPKLGRVLLFPPMWMYPHIGHPPTDNVKYILSTSVQYT